MSTIFVIQSQCIKPRNYYLMDLNGDGISDYKVTYANGDQQILYVLP